MNVCAFDDTSHVLGNQGGFLEASTSKSSKSGKQWELLKLPEEDQVSHTRMDVINSPFAINSFHDEDFNAFEKHNPCIGSNLMKNMGYEGKGLGFNGQVIVNPIQVVELPQYVELGYVRDKVGEISKTTVERHSKPTQIGESSSNKSKSVQYVERTSQHSRDSVHFK